MVASDADLARAYAAMRAAYQSWAKLQNQDSVKLWGGMLRDADGEKLVAAVMRLAKESKWPPTVAEIREAAGCVDPETAARRAASAEAASKHAAWVAEQDRIAIEQARENLRREGIDPDNIQPVKISELVKGIGR